MQLRNRIVTLVLLPALLFATPAFAQQTRVVDAALVDQALAHKAASETAQRDLVRRVLDRSDARQVAASLGLSAERASSAVGMLSGAELNTLAQHAVAVEANELAGGANTVVISLTTVLLVLIIVILLVS